MFGYVKVYQPELKIKEYEAYKGVYCTLCKEMGKEYGVLSRFLLSYDGAFYVLYKMGLDDTQVTAKKSHCTFNPCKKCTEISCNSNVYRLASAVTVILAYFKFIDNLNDSRFLKRLCLYLIYPYFALLKRKAKKKYPEIFKTIEDGMNLQFQIEKEEKPSIDKSADSTAKMLGWLFSLGEDKEKSKNAYDFGYQLGRTVYFLDAFDDYESDIKENSFNPFKHCDDFIRTASISINLSVGALSQIYEQQDKNQFSPIISNVIYDGLNYQLKRIIEKYRGESNE